MTGQPRRLRPSADATAGAGLGLTVTVVLFAVSWAHVHRSGGGGVDLAYFRQAVWLIQHGRPLFVTSRGLYLLGDHASPLIYPVAWVCRLLPVAQALLFLQAGALGLTAVGLHRFARSQAGLGPAGALAAGGSVLLYPTAHNLVIADFHPEVLALPAMVGAALFAGQRRWWPYAACLAVMLAAKEDFGIVALSMGLWLIVTRRPRAGALTAAAGAAVTVLDLGWMLPHYAGGAYTQSVRLARYGPTTGAIARFLVLHPWRVPVDLATAVNAGLVIGLLAPLLFLPLLAPEFLIPAVPLEVLLLLSNQPGAHLLRYHYTVVATAWVLVAGVAGLGRLRRAGAPRLTGVVLAGALIAGFVQYAEDSPTRHPWNWLHADATDAARRAAARRIPASAPVAATVSVVDLFARRPLVYNFPEPFVYYSRSKADPIPLAARQAGVEWCVIDLNGAWVWPGDRAEFAGPLASSWGFSVVSSDHGVLVLHRGH